MWNKHVKNDLTRCFSAESLLLSAVGGGSEQMNTCRLFLIQTGQTGCKLVVNWCVWLLPWRGLLYWQLSAELWTHKQAEIINMHNNQFTDSVSMETHLPLYTHLPPLWSEVMMTSWGWSSGSFRTTLCSKWSFVSQEGRKTGSAGKLWTFTFCFL